mmetsp:Transcript_73451/g.157383  ORF Transcript_73451/g.157383 Transcript_73451/m.157383 type:complete len:94 (-) Transcript_73451:258-539(-)
MAKTYVAPGWELCDSLKHERFKWLGHNNITRPKRVLSDGGDDSRKVSWQNEDLGAARQSPRVSSSFQRMAHWLQLVPIAQCTVKHLGGARETQ